ncbi:MAG: hypothetical protein R6T83_01670, partial [Salinibacter sp.]
MLQQKQLWMYNVGAHYEDAHGNLEVTPAVVEAARLLCSKNNGDVAAAVRTITDRTIFDSHEAARRWLIAIATERPTVLKGAERVMKALAVRPDSIVHSEYDSELQITPQAAAT